MPELKADFSVSPCLLRYSSSCELISCLISSFTFLSCSYRRQNIQITCSFAESMNFLWSYWWILLSFFQCILLFSSIFPLIFPSFCRIISLNSLAIPCLKSCSTFFTPFLLTFLFKPSTNFYFWGFWGFKSFALRVFWGQLTLLKWTCLNLKNFSWSVFSFSECPYFFYSFCPKERNSHHRNA